MESMTGFAKSSAAQADFKSLFQFRSLNARFLEMKFRLPYEASYLEEEFRKRTAKIFQRGTVEISLNLEKSKMDLQVEELKIWIAEYKKMAQILQVKENLDMEKVLKKSFQDEGRRALNSDEEQIILNAFNEGLLKLRKQRLSEGKGLKKILKDEVKNLKESLRQVKNFVKSHKKELQREWEQKFKKLKVEVEPLRLESEVALLLEKGDLSEEIERLDLHIKEFLKIINSNQNLIGKKLDFFCQELAREANTIASKSKKADLTRLSVDLKSSVEKLRQQVQNIQ